MATEYYSTEATVQAKATALDIQRWLDPDGDGNISETALESGLKQAKATVLSYVQPRYGSDVTDLWDSDTRPEFIGQASDWIALYFTLPGYSIDHPLAVRFYDQTITDLEDVRTYKRMIPGIDFQSGQTFDTATTDDDSVECDG